MQRINVQYFYRLATALRPLAEVKEGAKIEDIDFDLYVAKQELSHFLHNDLMPPETSFQAGMNLHNALEIVLEKDADTEDVLSLQEAYAITTRLATFETVFAAEFERRDVYCVTRKGIYSTAELIDRSENAFSPAIRAKIPDALPDINQAGRCIAFELPTAAAFHIFRAIEAVSKQYVIVLCGDTPKATNQTSIGGHIKMLENTDADKRAIDALEKIRTLHRNPVMHPEQSLGMDEVLNLFGLAQSAIRSMVADMEKRAETPDPSLTGMLPVPESETEDSEAAG